VKKFLVGIATALGGIALTAIVVFVAAVLMGTILWWLWPIAIPAAFPAGVRQGLLAARLTWGQAVALSWVFAILFKGTPSTGKDKE
jgi:hypothetical protein